MTLEKLALRHSVRNYSDRPLTESDKSKLKSAITAVNNFEAGLHFSLVTDCPAPFQGFSRSYGLFTNVKNFIALVIDKSSYPMMEEKAGYYGEMLVMKCVEMGLGTCFVAGTYSRKHVNVQLRAGWEIIALITIGYPSETTESFIARKARSFIKRKSKSPLQFYEGSLPWDEVEKNFPNMLPALKAVSLAPSAVNKQPVVITVHPSDAEADNERTRYGLEFKQVEAESRRFLLSPLYSVLQPELDFENKYRIEAKVDHPKQLIDLGIAMWNFEQLFQGYWEWGNPARFIPCKG